MIRVVAIAALALVSGCAGLQKRLVPPPVKTWDEARTAPALPCPENESGILVLITDRGPCLPAAELEQVVREAKTRTGTQRASLVGATLRIGSFQVRCPSKIIESCSDDSVMVVRRKWWKRYFIHELGHLLVKRSGMSPDGDRTHDICGFWLRLDGTECPLLQMLDAPEDED